MKKYLYLICLLCCCAFVSNIQVVSAQSSAPYVRVGLLQGVQEVVITANDDFVYSPYQTRLIAQKYAILCDLHENPCNFPTFITRKNKICFFFPHVASLYFPQQIIHPLFLLFPWYFETKGVNKSLNISRFIDQSLWVAQ